MAPFRMRVQRAAMPSFEFYEPSSDEAEVGRAFERVFINYGSMTRQSRLYLSFTV
jgi:hypothetical protein